MAAMEFFSIRKEKFLGWDKELIASSYIVTGMHCLFTPGHHPSIQWLSTGRTSLWLFMCNAGLPWDPLSAGWDFLRATVQHQALSTALFFLPFSLPSRSFLQRTDLHQCKGSPCLLLFPLTLILHWPCCTKYILYFQFCHGICFLNWHKALNLFLLLL